MGIKGDSYTGEWKFGKPDGYGTHRWVNGKKDLENLQTFLKISLYFYNFRRHLHWRVQELLKARRRKRIF